MRLEYQILSAVALDLALGDPRWLPHPVRAIAWTARRLERITRRMIPWTVIAGIVASLSVYAIAGGAAWGLIRLAGMIHPIGADVAAILIIYTTLAARDLASHAIAVFTPLARGDLNEAKSRVAMIVGRDTAGLDEAGIARAAVESVAESTVDGVTGPLFFAIIAGPVGAMVYRAINTLDSMFGYKNEEYYLFGWAPARIDDLANLLPARLTAPLMCLAAALLGMRGRAALRIAWRDSRHHESPNAGFPEATMAGALGVQLGGVNYYGGEPLAKPTIGDAVEPLSASHIRRATVLMFATEALFVGAGLAARWGVQAAWLAGTRRIMA